MQIIINKRNFVFNDFANDKNVNNHDSVLINFESLLFCKIALKKSTIQK